MFVEGVQSICLVPDANELLRALSMCVSLVLELPLGAHDRAMKFSWSSAPGGISDVGLSAYLEHIFGFCVRWWRHDGLLALVRRPCEMPFG